MPAASVSLGWDTSGLLWGLQKPCLLLGSRSTLLIRRPRACLLLNLLCVQTHVWHQTWLFVPAACDWGKVGRSSQASISSLRVEEMLKTEVLEEQESCLILSWLTRWPAGPGAWVLIPVLHPMSCLTLGKLLNLSVLQCLCQMGRIL